MMKRFLLFGLVLLLSTCGTPDVSTPAPTPLAINLFYPMALQAWADNLANCAANNPRIALYFIQSTALDANLLTNDLALVLSQSTQESSGTNLFQVGWEQVVVVANKDNTLSQLTSFDVKSIYSGHITKWENDSNLPIQVWVMPEGDPTRTIFDNAVLSSQSLSSEAMLAPDPSAMLEAISENVEAIGYLPRSFFTTSDSTFASKVRILQLEPSLEVKLRQPVIAVTHGEPEGLLRELMVCLQRATP